MKYTVKEFAHEIRKLYPGDYDDLSDQKLVDLWLKKYPKDREKIIFSESKESPIGHPKSKSTGLIIKIVTAVAILTVAIFTNPTKQDFVREAINQYGSKNGYDKATTSFTNELMGGLVESLVESHNYLFFSTYQLQIKNNFLLPKINIDISAIGLFGNFIIY